MATFTNMATLTYNGNTVNSNIVTGQIREVLAMTKTAVRDTYAAGEDITYAVSIVNTGALPITGLTLTDDLGAYPIGGQTVYPLAYAAESLRYFVDGVLQEAPEVTGVQPLIITGITVPAGGNVLVLYEAEVTAYAPLAEGGTIVNRVTAEGGGLTMPVTAEETVTVRSAADLSVTKALDPVIVPENGQLTYTFTIRNYGNEPVVATDNAILRDLFDPILELTAVTYNGEDWVEGVQYTYNGTEGLFETLPGQITVPAATFTQNPDGTWAVDPGVATLTVTGTV